jgi:hypothetical protein
MAGKRPIGGNPAAAETTAQETPTTPEKDISLPKTPDFSSLWGGAKTEESAPAISDEQLGNVKVGSGETPALREEREAMPADAFAEESKSRRFVSAVANLGRKGFVNPKKKISYRDQAIIRHGDLTEISGSLSSKVEELRRQVPIIEDGKASSMYDRIHSILDLADHHIAQASIEHMRGHYGVDYLDSHPNMENKAVDGVGMSEIRKAAQARTDTKGLISVAPIMPKGSINFTRRAAELLKQASAHLTTISVQGQAAARQDKRLTAPDPHDVDGALQKNIDDISTEYANTIDVGHKLQNPDRQQPEGMASATAQREESKRINTPDFLSAMGEPEIGASRAADIKSMFDRRGKAPQVLAAAKKVHATIQRTLAWNAFHRIFGAKLSANEAAQAANMDFIKPTLQRNADIRTGNDYEAAKVRTLRQQYPVTPVFADMPVAEKVARDLQGRNVSVDKTTDLPADSLMSRAKEAIEKANASGDTATAGVLQGHIDSITHHTTLAQQNADPKRGAVVKSGSSTAALRLPTESDTVGEVGKRSHLYGNVGGPNPGTSSNSLMTTADYADRTLSDSTSPIQTVERSAGNLAANPGDSITEITKDKSSTASHPYYEKPVVDTDSSGNTFVREGKHDAAIAETKAALLANTDPKDKSIIDKKLHAKLFPELERLYAEHRKAKSDLLEQTQDGVKNKKYVGQKALSRADQEFMTSGTDSKSVQDKVSVLKTALADYHTGAASRSTEALKMALFNSGNIKGREGEAPVNTGIQAAVKPEEELPSRESLPYSQLPNPELPDRKTLFKRFMATSGVNSDPNEPNVVQLRDKKGNPLDYKKARKRGAVFADAALNQYAYGPTFKVPEDEAGFYKQEQEVAKQPVRGTATRESFGRVQQGAVESLKAEDQARLEQSDREEAASRALARSVGVPEDLLPMVTSGSGVRGTLPLGDKGSKPLVSASGKSAIVPGIGRVAIPERKKTIKKAKTGKLTVADILPADMLDAASGNTPQVPELDVRSLMRKQARGKAGASAAGGMEEVEATAAPVKLGRQFKGYTVEGATENEIKKLGEV